MSNLDYVYYIILSLSLSLIIYIYIYRYIYIIHVCSFRKESIHLLFHQYNKQSKWWYKQKEILTINTTILNDQTISKYTVETAVDIESLETQSVLTNVITSLIQEWSSAFKSEGIVLPFHLKKRFCGNSLLVCIFVFLPWLSFWISPH